MNKNLFFSFVLAVSLFHNGLLPIWPSWSTGVDQSVGCPAIRPMHSDIATAVDDDSVLTLTANGHNRGGLFLNAILGRQQVFFDNSRYIYSGSFRKLPGSNPEQINVNLQLVERATEHYAELIWTLNPYSPLYGWVWTRGPSLVTHKLFYLGDDTQWHRFVLIADYREQPAARIVRRIQVDDQFVEPDSEMGTLPKSWASSFMTLLETANMYTGCATSVQFKGESQWRNVQLSRMALR